MRARVDGEFVSTSLREDGAIRVTMSDGTMRTVRDASDGAYVLRQSAGGDASRRRLRTDSVQAAGAAFRIAPVERRGRVMRSGDKGEESVAELLEPSFLLDTRDESPVAWSDDALVHHRRSLVAPEVALLSRVGASGLAWTLDLAQAVDTPDAGVALEWLTKNGEEVVMLVDVRAGRRSRTELVRIDARGQVVGRTPLR